MRQLRDFDDVTEGLAVRLVHPLSPRWRPPRLSLTVRTSIHESGHAVASAVLQRLIGVTIRPTLHPEHGISLGRCLSRRGRTAGERELDTIVALSGVAAERQIVGAVRWTGARPDLLDAWRAVRDAKKIGELYVLSHRIVHDHAPAIRRVAHELLQHGGLDARDVMMAIRGNGR